MTRDLIDLFLKSSKIDITQAEHGRTNIVTLHEVSVEQVLNQFTVDELMKAANDKRKEAKSKDFSFTDASLFFEPVIDSPLPNNFIIKDEDK